jgi:DNA-binding beta-propeller fold protein YncE
MTLPRHNVFVSVAGPAAGALVAVCFSLAAGCGPSSSGPVRERLVFGSHGYTAGKFHRPRGLAWDEPGGFVYVVDWAGRVQKFTTNGEFRASWRMPDIEVGKPEDLCVAPDGRVLIADTHYSRILEYTPDGKHVGGFGRYGRGPGEFIYPVGIACDSNGCLYVTEYGENDRVQKFDRQGHFLMAWGSFGSGPGQFQRPSGLEVAGDRVYVADAVNHRIQVFDLEGALVQTIGKQGSEPGLLRYPYDVAVKGGFLYVLEYGNQRIQKFTLAGEPVETLGRPGSGPGGLASPWRCVRVGDSISVSDTENHRVVVLEPGF